MDDQHGRKDRMTTGNPVTDQHRADALLIWNYHQMGHQPSPCSAGIGLGSHDLGVAAAAADLYHAGMFPVLVFTGANSPTTAAPFPRGEAVHYAEHAMSLGVPRDAIIIEPRAANTGQNIEFSRHALAAAGIPVTSVMLISKPYMERRAYATMRRSWPEAEAVCASENAGFDDYLKSSGDDRLVIDMLIGDLQRVIEYPARGFAIAQAVPGTVTDAYWRLIAAGYDSRLMKGLTARGELTCAIHQPNFFPRLSTLAKLYAADIWIILDDVQFTRRDYQHRCRLAAAGDARLPERWLPVPVHLPDGRATLIKDARLADSAVTARRVPDILRQYYRHGPHAAAVLGLLPQLQNALASCERLADVTEYTTAEMLRLTGWPGVIHHSSDLPAGSGRSERLADLTSAVGATTYLCGTGGSRYLDPVPFRTQGLRVAMFRPPTHSEGITSQDARRLTGLSDLADAGPAALAARLAEHALLWREPSVSDVDIG
jgi:uncharacterized SAM-binding protein YcdF (DUF218 family)